MFELDSDTLFAIIVSAYIIVGLIILVVAPLPPRRKK